MTEREREMADAAIEFTHRFISVFHTDWPHALHMISGKFPEVIAPAGTFIEPRVRNEEHGWMLRAGLLEAFRALLPLLVPYAEDEPTRKLLLSFWCPELIERLDAGPAERDET